MGRQPGLFDLEERLAGLSAEGDGLERLGAVVDFELFRPELERTGLWRGLGDDGLRRVAYRGG
jgi:hypothetical protein